VNARSIGRLQTRRLKAVPEFSAPTRTRLDDLDGARIWTGHGVLAHNLVKISALPA
jgi:transposase, IS5 family